MSDIDCFLKTLKSNDEIKMFATANGLNLESCVSRRQNILYEKSNLVEIVHVDNDLTRNMENYVVYYINQGKLEQVSFDDNLNRDNSVSVLLYKWTCFNCNKCFSTTSNKNRHVKKSCIFRKSKKDRKVQYSCSTCGISFSTKSNLTRHVKNLHQSNVE